MSEISQKKINENSYTHIGRGNLIESIFDLLFEDVDKNEKVITSVS